MRKLKLEGTNVLCYYVREFRVDVAANGERHEGLHPVACVMFCRDSENRWYRGMAVAPVTGDEFNYDGYRSAAYARLRTAVRNPVANIGHKMPNIGKPGLARFFSCVNTDMNCMQYLSQANVCLTGYEQHIADVMKPAAVNLLGRGQQPEMPGFRLIAGTRPAAPGGELWTALSSYGAPWTP